MFTAVGSQPQDLWKKATKAQWYAKNVGPVYGKLLIACPLKWLSEERMIIQAAVDCNFLPLYEVERGITKLTYDAEAKGKKVSVEEWLKMMGKTKHVLKQEFASVLQVFQDEVNRRDRCIKAMSDHPDL